MGMKATACLIIHYMNIIHLYVLELVGALVIYAILQLENVIKWFLIVL